MPVCFSPFSFNTCQQFTSLLNLFSHFWFNALWLVYLHLCELFFPYGNIILDSCLFDLHHFSRNVTGA